MNIETVDGRAARTANRLQHKGVREQGIVRWKMLHAKDETNISTLDYIYAFEMAIACLLAYLAMTAGLARLVDMPTDLLGGMWAAVSAIFVFRENEHDSLSAGISRLAATCVSFALCLPYLWLFPPTPVGIAMLLAILHGPYDAHAPAR